MTTTHPDPTLVYRSRNLPAAKSLVAFLRDTGIHAHLVNPSNEHGQYGQPGEGPVFGLVYGVYVVDCMLGDTQALLDDWRQLQDSARIANDRFCYHCGEIHETHLATCPRCGKTLDRSEVDPAHDIG
ncbi:hypothetical protein [Rhodopirellula sallentina]|uniref:hypothetical protein n=1 Tax=Rhodopirellula sallentina TaxID=1263869 RepID=UPI00034A06C0|nr:hypothetical protein [Rhodopirellula sallentina]